MKTPPSEDVEGIDSRDEGRAQAKRLGEWFSTQGLKPSAVRSSPWCRCLDTARLAFGEPRPWAPLDSFFQDRSRAGPQTEALRAGIARIAPPRVVAMVTHQVNITALTDLVPAQGEVVGVRWRDGAARPEFRFRVAAPVGLPAPPAPVAPLPAQVAPAFPSRTP